MPARCTTRTVRRRPGGRLAEPGLPRLLVATDIEDASRHCYEEGARRMPVGPR